LFSAEDKGEIDRLRARLRKYQTSAMRRGHQAYSQVMPMVDVEPGGSGTGRPHLLLRGAGSTWRVLLDTGAAVSIVSARMIQAGVFPTPMRAPERVIVNASGGRMKVQGVSEVSLWIASRRCDASLWVVEDYPHDMILGTDFLSRAGIVLDCGRRRIGFADGFDIGWDDDQSGKLSVVASVDTASSSVAHVVGSVKLDHLDQTRKGQVGGIIAEFAKCFSEREDQYALARVQPMVVELTEKTQPIWRLPYRLAAKEEEFLQKRMDELLAAGVVRMSSSHWAAPCKVVPKGVDQMREVIDFRCLNGVVEDDPHPVANARDIFDRLAGCKFFSRLDLQHAYLQIPVHRDSQHLLAFVTPWSHLEYTRAPFGFKNSGKALQRALSQLFHGVKGLYGYSDDWLIATATWEQHLEVFREALVRLESRGFMLKPSKCEIGLAKIKYLGRVLSESGVAADMDDVRALLEMPAPADLSELRSFLGSMQWFASHIAGSAKLMAPLYTLTKKGVVFSWGAEQAHAFQKIKKALTSAPVLRFPDVRKIFVLETDASAQGLAAVLIQDGYPVAYWSRTLRPAERRVGIPTLEISAVLEAVRHWSVLLRGVHFRVVTDHQALKWLQSWSEPAGKFAIWATELSAYDFEIVYRPGKKQGLADAMSRIVGHNGATVFALEVPDVLSEPEVFKAAQAEDDACRKIKKRLATHGSEQFVVNEQGILCFLAHVYDLPVLRPVVPESLIPRVLEDVHSRSGHLGVRALIRELSQAYFWNKMAEDAKDFVANCSICQRVNEPVRRRIPDAKPSAEFFNDLVAVDLMSGMATGAQGQVCVLAIVDYFSHYVEVVPLTSKTAETVHRAFVDNWVSKHGAPKRLLSDQGPEFTAAAFTNGVRGLGTNKVFTTAYHPQGNGVVERFNRTFTSMMRKKMLNKLPSSWPTFVSDIVEAWNTTVHEQTKVAPAVLAGRPFEAKSKKLGGGLSAPTERVREAAGSAAVQRNAERITETAERISNSGMRTYKVRDKVWVRDQVTRHATLSKFSPTWEGPFRVWGVRGPHAYLVGPMQGVNGRSRTVNVRDLKPFLDKKEWRRVQAGQGGPDYSSERTGRPPRGAAPVGQGRAEVDRQPPHGAVLLQQGQGIGQLPHGAVLLQQGQGIGQLPHGAVLLQQGQGIGQLPHGAVLEQQVHQDDGQPPHGAELQQQGQQEDNEPPPHGAEPLQQFGQQVDGLPPPGAVPQQGQEEEEELQDEELQQQQEQDEEPAAVPEQGGVDQQEAAQAQEQPAVMQAQDQAPQAAGGYGVSRRGRTLILSEKAREAAAGFK
jgi:transposase InsO family protein